MEHIVVVLNGEATLDIRDAKFPEGNIRLQYQQCPIAGINRPRLAEYYGLLNFPPPLGKNPRVKHRD